MNIEDHIRWAIYNYPSLYRVVNHPNLSRLHVLNHIFFVIGNGYEWKKKKGILETDDRGYMTELPEGFFQKKLFSFDVKPDQRENFKEFLADRFYYNLPRLSEFVVECTQDEANKFAKERKEIVTRFPWEQRAGSKKLKPYPLCQYSALVELLEGKTNSLHIPNYSFSDFPVRQDWLMACVEIAHAAKSYYIQQENVDFKQLDYICRFLTKFDKHA